MNTENSVIYIEDDRLFEYAANTARLMTGLREGGSASVGLKRDFAEIRHCHSLVRRRYSELPSPPSGCEWLMDNYYMVQREYAAILPDICRGKNLRRCDSGSVCLEICRTLLLCSRDKLTPERFTLFLEGFQSVLVLRCAELELLPAFLSAAVIGRLAEVCRTMVRSATPESFSPSFQALFSDLRLFSGIDTAQLINDANLTGRILSKDPTGEYSRMDRATRADYLRRVERNARREHTEEHVYAAKLIEEAAKSGKHIGYLLFDEKQREGGAYICANVLLTLFFSLLPAFAFGQAAAALLLLVPISELVKCLIDYIMSHFVQPKRLFRMETENGIPPEGRTVCVISTLIGSECDASRLEKLYHCCRAEGDALYFGLLADLPAADEESIPGDSAALSALRRDINALNLKYGNRFYLFTRKRRFDGEKYTPHERKRGAIMELAKLLCEKENELTVIGDKDALAGTRYILTLDSDTLVYPGSVGQLIGAMLHPLIKPVKDRENKLVTAGHAIIQPRIDIELQSSCETDFALIYSGGGGSDPYGTLTGELYMDAFGSGGFSGKGLIDAEALLLCTESFPQGGILSHDAPEGAFLHGAYMGDAEFADRFPFLPLAWFSRQHRWIRGDWQNLRFIFSGALRPIDRWRLFDCLRRSLLAPLTFIAILTGFFSSGGGIALAAWAALLSILSRVFLALAEDTLKKREKVPLRRHVRLLNGVGGAIVHSFIQLWLLPFEAWVSLSAIATALFRMLVSHKKLLQWQTSAQSSKNSDLSAHIRAMWLPVMLGVVLMAFCPSIIGKASGFMWLLSPVAATALALPANNILSLSEGEREYVIEAARRGGQYFREFFSEEDNFLPPDNFQEQPPVGLAHRTSPTNIALALTCAAAGCKMGYLSTADAAETIERMTESLEKLPKCRGHLFNWYDTRTLLPLDPPYVSTVDSGNLYAGLVCVKQFLISVNEMDLAMRLDALMERMDFSFLYDKNRQLFHICYDSAGDRGTGGHYDLMASEAMLTSYIAAAKGDVPVKHWRRLSRAQLQKDGYRGLASWTGTMFEYLMPELFLPIYRGSLLYESAHFCVYVQKHRVWQDKPWGISESAFCSLDSAMNYRYKANGCDALALKRGQDSDVVISPYSSFLALAIDPVGSVKNLRRLERFGAVGRFGFIEALDFTPGRCRSDRGEPVRCYMAHHVGMSIIAAANAACDGCMQKLFMSDERMAAFSLLLQEHLPNSAAVIRKAADDSSQRPERASLSAWILRGGAEDDDKHCCVLSNGAYNIVSSSYGDSSASCGPVTLYSDVIDGSGVSIELEHDGAHFMLIPGTHRELWELCESGVLLTDSFEGISVKYALCAAACDCGEKRTVRICSQEDAEIGVKLSFVPLIAPFADYANHPAFWQLGLTAEAADNGLVVHRIQRGGCSSLWLAILSDKETGFSAEKRGGRSFLSQPFVQGECRLSLRAGEETAVSFALCLGMDREEAIKGANRILLSAETERGNMVGAAALHMHMLPENIGFAMKLLNFIKNTQLSEAEPKSSLWQYGISGDLPLFCCDGGSAELEKLTKAFCLLKSCGIEADMAVFSNEQGEYRQPVLQRINRILSEISLESLLNSPGGIHVVPESAAQTVLSRSVYSPGRKKTVLSAAPVPPRSAPRTAVIPKYAQDGDSFRFLVHNTLPPRQWQNIISNGCFGYIASDCGGGYMWLDNAREMRINPPVESISALYGSERLWIEQGGESFSLFAENDDIECEISFSPGCAVWEKTIAGRKIKTTAFVPLDSDMRILLIEGGEGLRLKWHIKALFGGADTACVRLFSDNGAIYGENPEAYLKNIRFVLSASMPLITGTQYSDGSFVTGLILDECTVLTCGCADEEHGRLNDCGDARKALQRVKDYWNDITGKVRLSGGPTDFEAYMNTWCVYQTLACRLMGRASLYQSGGAVGFRDQLQDAVNLLLIDRKYAREQILECCAHQYTEGDVMHWWHRHPEGDKGIRTRCSDDFLWLCWALCEYCEKTGDTAICEEKQPYLDSEPLKSSERDRYESPKKSVSVRVIDHAAAALECCIRRGLGEHGLPRMGSGDWNDGLNEVRGESVWLAWFASCCAEKMAVLCEKFGIPGQRYRRFAARLAASAEKAWSGHWYLRGYFEDGEAVGGGERIDSIAQSWAVLCRTDTENTKAEVALSAALNRLVDRKHGIVRLLDPPFSENERSPGYIVGCGEGFRENGGQYTHGAIWLAMACFETGRADEGWEILKLLLPQTHDMRRYGAEPFVLAADVYSAEGHEGEAGWSWYTGSAGWYFRAVYETMLGLKLRGGKLTIRPALPAAVDKVRVHWTSPTGKVYEIEEGHSEILVDGEKYSGEELD